MVRKSLVLILCLIAGLSLAESLSGKVISVADGDTITVLRSQDGTKTPVKIRLSGIDTPEKKQDYGNKAKQALSAKVFGKTVTVTYKTKDRYGRTIGDIHLNGVWINLEMVSEGLAWHYKHYSKDKRLADAEAAARKMHYGLWADKDPIPPWDYRRTKRRPQSTKKAPAGAGGYWLNTGSGTRHNSGCKYFKNTKRGRIRTLRTWSPTRPPAQFLRPSRRATTTASR